MTLRQRLLALPALLAASTPQSGGCRWSILQPCRLFQPRPDVSGIGLRRPVQELEHRAPRPFLPLSHLSMGEKILLMIHRQVRRVNSAPAQANISQSFQLDKRKGVPGPAGIRLISAFDSWWRLFYRVLLVDQGNMHNHAPWAYGGVRGRRREGSCWPLAS